MRHGTTATAKIPAAPLVGQPIDPEVVEFREAFEARSTLDEIIREGARKMLQTAIEAEVDDFVATHADRRDEQRQATGRPQWLPPIQRTADRSRYLGGEAAAGSRQRPRRPKIVFSSRPASCLPYLRRSKAIDELIPWLYLKGISTGDFSEALQALVGRRRPKASVPTSIVRLKEQW